MIRQCRSSTCAIFFWITRGGTAMGDKTRTRYARSAFPRVGNLPAKGKQGTTRFDRWSLSVMRMFQQLSGQ